MRYKTGYKAQKRQELLSISGQLAKKKMVLVQQVSMVL